MEKGVEDKKQNSTICQLALGETQHQTGEKIK
jgi:hypothetical protein